MHYFSVSPPSSKTIALADSIILHGLDAEREAARRGEAEHVREEVELAHRSVLWNLVFNRMLLLNFGPIFQKSTRENQFFVIELCSNFIKLKTPL